MHTPESTSEKCKALTFVENQVHATPEWRYQIPPETSIATPVEYFRALSDSLLTHMAQQSNLYACQTDIKELEQFLGVTFYMSLIGMPGTRKYWGSTCYIPQVADVMSLHRWENIKQNLHFTDNSSIPEGNTDRLIKLRELFEQIRGKLNKAEAKRKLYSDKNWIEGVKLGRELYDKLLEWLPRREASAKELRTIADRLDQLRRDVNISRTVGSSVAVVGGLATIGSLILAVATAGLSTPLVVATVGGTAAAVAGAATSAISQIVESYKNGEEFKSARKIMEADESAAAEVAGLLEKLRIMGDRIISSSKGNYLVWDQFAVSDRQSSHMATQRILSAFMCFGAAASMGLPYKALAYSVSKGGGLAFHGMDKLGPLTSKLTQKLLFLSSKVGTIVTHGLGQPTGDYTCGLK
ncbi:PiggyBac transposable element-derived protein 3 [Acipenser ruthenus]|uniref:PiggyBac transposable element-derived protein 3 n=1 Tax=Acipenser ruthenus TaxID=7906 RepID=A0A444V735_ACIRT|nr:PiggyBac transposable element-derived protein 3 [Acipenser ruthenus]